MRVRDPYGAPRPPQDGEAGDHQDDAGEDRQRPGRVVVARRLALGEPVRARDAERDPEGAEGQGEPASHPGADARVEDGDGGEEADRDEPARRGARAARCRARAGGSCRRRCAARSRRARASRSRARCGRSGRRGQEGADGGAADGLGQRGRCHAPRVSGRRRCRSEACRRSRVRFAPAASDVSSEGMIGAALRRLQVASLDQVRGGDERPCRRGGDDEQAGDRDALAQRSGRPTRRPRRSGAGRASPRGRAGRQSGSQPPRARPERRSREPCSAVKPATASASQP